jgi:hypothetical protein
MYALAEVYEPVAKVVVLELAVVYANFCTIVLGPVGPVGPGALLAVFWKVPSENCIPPMVVAVFPSRKLPAIKRFPPYTAMALPAAIELVPMPTLPLMIAPFATGTIPGVTV